MSDARRIAVLTTGRQDYGILRSTILALRDDPRVELRVWAGGMHTSERHGAPIRFLADDGVTVDRVLSFLDADGSDVAGDSARALAATAAAIRDSRPDMLVLVGDRTETLAAALAAVVERVPVVHLHGGEESEGAIDNVCRHAITKLSHLHLVSHELHARRVRQMGEPPDAVRVVGAPGLDQLHRSDLPARDELAASLGHHLDDPVVLVTVHPTTLAEDRTREVAAVARAMEMVDATYVVTLPNADDDSSAIRDFWEQWAPGRPNVIMLDALGATRYAATLRISRAVLGNSSSGIIEAPAAGVPVVNVGDRQRGRLRTGAVLDVPAESERIVEGLRLALEGRVPVAGAAYPSGAAAPRIVEALTSWVIPNPPRKRFEDLACQPLA